MKTETFREKDKQDLDKKIWDWMLTHGNFVVEKTHPMEKMYPLISIGQRVRALKWSRQTWFRSASITKIQIRTLPARA